MCRPPLSFLCSAVKTLKLQAFLYFIFNFFLWWVGSSELEKREKQQLSTALLPGRVHPGTRVAPLEQQ